MSSANNSEQILKNIEENILNYNYWLQKNHREDKMENYERFLQAK